MWRWCFVFYELYTSATCVMIWCAPARVAPTCVGEVKEYYTVLYIRVHAMVGTATATVKTLIVTDRDAEGDERSGAWWVRCSITCSPAPTTTTLTATTMAATPDDSERLETHARETLPCRRAVRTCLCDGAHTFSYCV